MAEEQLTLTFDGPAVETNRIRVRDLAPSLMAMSDLVREAQREIYPEDPGVEVHVAASRPGSYTVDLIVQGAGIVGLVQQVLAEGHVTSADALRDLVSKISELFKLVKRIRGHTVARTEDVGDDNIRIYTDGGDSYVIHTDVLNLYQDAEVRQAARDVVRPVRSDDYTEVRIDHGTDRVEITENDWDSFTTPTPDYVLSDSTHEMTVQVVSPAFDGKQWRLHDGEHSFWARIDDEDFQERVERREEQFASGDRLRVRMRIRQVEIDGRIRVRRIVEEVLDHQTVQRSEQLGFDEHLQVEDGDLPDD